LDAYDIATEEMPENARVACSAMPGVDGAPAKPSAALPPPLTVGSSGIGRRGVLACAVRGIIEGVRCGAGIGAGDVGRRSRAGELRGGRARRQHKSPERDDGGADDKGEPRSGMFQPGRCAASKDVRNHGCPPTLLPESDLAARGARVLI
jgi:hypothetical protein